MGYILPLSLDVAFMPSIIALYTKVLALMLDSPKLFGSWKAFRESFLYVSIMSDTISNLQPIGCSCASEIKLSTPAQRPSEIVCYTKVSPACDVCKC